MFDFENWLSIILYLCWELALPTSTLLSISVHFRRFQLNHLPSQQLFYKFPATPRPPPSPEFFWFLRVWVYSIAVLQYCSIAYTWIQNINKFIICFYKLKSNWLESFYLLNDLVENGTTFLTLPESGWPPLTIGDKFSFDISKEEEHIRLIQFIRKTAMPVHKVLLDMLF